MEEANSILVLTDENGNEIEFEYLDVVEYQGEEYILLYPADTEGDDIEIVIYRIEPTENEDEENYVDVEDEETLYAVYDIFKERFKDQINFAD